MSDDRKILPFPPSSAWRESLLLLATACVLAIVVWVVHPHRLPLAADAPTYELELTVPLIQAAAALQAFEDSDSFHVFVDTRPRAYELPHVPGAVVVRPDSFAYDVRTLIEDFERTDDLILYGDAELAIPAAVSRQLADREFTRVRILDGGYPAWVAAGGETAPPLEVPAP